MKIKSWEELNEVQNDYHCIVINNQFIYLQTFGETIISISKDVKKELIIKTLKLFGFDIKFEEAPKLSEKEWHFVNFLSDKDWVTKDSTKDIYVYTSKPEWVDNEYWAGEVFGVYQYGLYDNAEIFPFITPDMAWSVKELRELEVCDEQRRKTN